MAEKVLFVDGHYEIEPWRMQEEVKQHEMNSAAIQKIIDDRMMYLTWMHDQEACRCLDLIYQIFKELLLLSAQYRNC